MKAADGGGEYGRMAMRTTQASSLFAQETEHTQQVWMSHGDEAVRLPEGFTSVATSEQVSGLEALPAGGQQERVCHLIWQCVPPQDLHVCWYEQ